MEFLFHILVIVAIFGLLAASLDLVAGFAGMLSLCHAALFGTGAYAFAILTTKLALSWLLSLTAAVACTAVMGLLISLFCARFRGDTLVLATLGFQMVLHGLFLNLRELTEGPMGITGIPRPSILQWVPQTNLEFLVFAVPIVGVCVLSLQQLTRSTFGMGLVAVRDDEVFLQSLGGSVTSNRVTAFAISAAIAGLCGALYASYTRFIEPSSFSLGESIVILTMVIIGGPARTMGSFLGAAVLLSTGEILRFLGLPASVAAHSRQVLYGTFLVAVLFLRPQGLIGRHSFSEAPRR